MTVGNISKQDCTGCKMCADLCPVDAIHFKVDGEGFWYPEIDESICVHCGRCAASCTGITAYRNRDAFNPQVYEAWNTSRTVRLGSTSGGIYYALAKEVLDMGGIVIGCAYAEDFHSAHHVICRTDTELARTMVSKYFQSDTEGIYGAVRRLLKDGATVLFSGTPCQTAALKHYLSAQADIYPCGKLIAVDFVCRGINSPRAYERFIEDLEIRYGSKVHSVRFKSKLHGWQSLGTVIEFENGKSYYRDRITSPYMNAYLNSALMARPCCSNCKYKVLPRVSDITLADFWGLDESKKDLHDGISLVMVNTETGAELFERVKEALYVAPQTLDAAVVGNAHILQPMRHGSRREEFFSRYENEGFESLVWDLMGITRSQLVKKKILSKISALLSVPAIGSLLRAAHRATTHLHLPKAQL